MAIFQPEKNDWLPTAPLARIKASRMKWLAFSCTRTDKEKRDYHIQWDQVIGLWSHKGIDLTDRNGLRLSLLNFKKEEGEFNLSYYHVWYVIVKRLKSQWLIERVFKLQVENTPGALMGEPWGEGTLSLHDGKTWTKWIVLRIGVISGVQPLIR